MSGGGMGVSSTGIGQPSGSYPGQQNPVGNNTTMTDDFGSANSGQPGIGLATLGDYLRQQQQPQQPQTISSLYQNILGRDPDQGGLDYWTQQANNGMSMNDIRDQFLASEEFATNPAAQVRYKSQFSNLVTPVAPAPVAPQPAPQVPVTQQTIAPPPPAAPVFNQATVSQSGDGGAMNYQYNRGGIASLMRR